MQIQVNTDHNIPGRDGLATHVTSVVETALDHVREHITRIEVHLSDENGSKSGLDDKRCVLEARLEHHRPVAVTHHATSLHQSVEGAAHKLTRLLDSTLGRQQVQKMRANPFILSEPLAPEADEADKAD
jgi:ribosome-associated translation inhibitor RaiA